jgi:hypothetical protein
LPARIDISPHLSGGTIRLQVSNRFGSPAVTFNTVSIADQEAWSLTAASASSIVTSYSTPPARMWPSRLACATRCQPLPAP